MSMCTLNDYNSFPALSASPYMRGIPVPSLALWLCTGLTAVSPYLPYTGETRTGHKQDHLEPGDHGWRLHNISGRPVMLTDHPQKENSFPSILEKGKGKETKLTL